MLVHLASPVLLTEAASALRNALRERGCVLTLSKTQEALARALGFADFHALKRHGGPASPLDHQLGPDLLRQRVQAQAKAISEYLGIDAAIAEGAVAEAKPSGLRRGSAGAEEAGLSPEVLRAVLEQAEWEFLRMLRGTPGDLVEAFVHAALASMEDREPDYGISVSGFLGMELPGLTMEMIHKVRREYTLEWRVTSPPALGWTSLRKHMLGCMDDACASIRGGVISLWPKGLDEKVALQLGCPVDEAGARISRFPSVRRIVHALISELQASLSSVSLWDYLVKPRNEHGFYEWKPGIEEAEEELWRPAAASRRKKDSRCFSKALGNLLIEGEIIREESSFNECEPDFRLPLDFRFFRARALDSGKVVGVVRGELVIDRSHGDEIDNEGFYCMAEGIDGQLALVSHVLATRHIAADDMFFRGDLVFLGHWEVAADRAGGSLAGDMLKAVLQELKRRYRRLSWLAYEIHPAQFPHPFDPALPRRIRREFELARRKLERRFDEIGVDRLMGPLGSAIRFEITPELYSMTNTQRLAVHIREAQGAGTGR